MAQINPIETTATLPLRVAIRVCPSDIPAHPQDRQNTLAKLYCRTVLSREFNPVLDPLNYDFSHALPGFDSDTMGKRWYLVDLNITSRLSKDDVLAIPHKVYALSKQGDEW